MGFIKSALSKIREVLSKMGLIKNVKSISDLSDLQIDDSFYQNIETWFNLYQGHNPKTHDVKIHTIGGTKKEKLKSLNMPKVVAQEMATLVFNERCEINISDNKTEDFIRDILRENKFSTNFQSNLEFSFGTGGVIIKPFVDNNKIKINFVTADSFIPISWDNGGIKEGVFLFETTKGKYKYTHLEWHVWEKDDENNKIYCVRNELYKAEKKNNGEIGHKVPLAELFDDLEDEVYIDGISQPLFVYVKPNNANFIDPKSPLGVAIYAHSIDTLQLIDTAYDSFFREFKLGKRRIIVPTSAIKSVVDETGQMVRYFDPTDEVYQAMDIGDMDNSKIHDNTVSLRVEEHISAINALLNILSFQIGFSSGTFLFDGKSVKTATEVISENSKTYRTKQSHEIIIEDSLRQMVDVILTLARLYGLYDAPEDYDTSISFDDSIAEDKTAETDREINLVNNQLQSKVRALIKIHGITKEEAEVLLNEINGENATVTESSVDNFSLFSDPMQPQQPPAGREDKEDTEEDEED